jgi:methenyltetrahydrofolate cyclohydrolase
MSFLDALAAPTPTPGGGSASAYAGAMAASLLEMYSGLTLARRSYAAVHEEMRRVRDQAAELKNNLSQAVDQDASAFAAVVVALKLDRGSEKRPRVLQKAMKDAAIIPMRVAEDSARVLQLARGVKGRGLKSANTDVAVATYLAQAAIKGALENVRENLAEISDDQFVAGCRERIAKIEAGLLVADADTSAV